MNEYDIKLERIEQKIARRKELCDRLTDAQNKSETIGADAEKLEAVYKILQQDTERLSHSWKTSKKQSALEEAKKKEHDAYARYLPVKQEQEALKTAVASIKQELESLKTIDIEYADALQEKQKHLQTQGGETSAKILHMENEKNCLQQRKAEVDSTIEFGQTVLETAESLFGSVVDFHSSAHVDAYSGILGSVYHKAFTGESLDVTGAPDLLSAAWKFGAGAVAKKKLPKLKEQVTAYTAKLSNVEIYMDDINLHVNGILALTDVLADNVFSDILVERKSSREVEKVRRVVNQIKDIQGHLSKERAYIEDNIRAIQSELNSLVRHSVTD